MRRATLSRWRSEREMQVGWGGCTRVSSMQVGRLGVHAFMSGRDSAGLRCLPLALESIRTTIKLITFGSIKPLSH